MASDYDCTLEGLPGPPAVRLGLRMLDRLKKESAERIVAARAEQPFDDADDLARRASLEGHEMSLLAAANALTSLSGHRHQQVWDASALKSAPPLLHAAPIVEDMVELAAAPEGEEIVWDCAALGLTLRRHPLALLRASLARRGLATAAELRDLPDGVTAVGCLRQVAMRRRRAQPGCRASWGSDAFAGAAWEIGVEQGFSVTSAGQADAFHDG